MAAAADGGPYGVTHSGQRWGRHLHDGRWWFEARMLQHHVRVADARSEFARERVGTPISRPVSRSIGCVRE